MRVLSLHSWRGTALFRRAGERRVWLCLLFVGAMLHTKYQLLSRLLLILDGVGASQLSIFLAADSGGFFSCRVERIFLTGSDDTLKNWSPNEALALTPTDYPIWSGTYPIYS